MAESFIGNVLEFVVGFLLVGIPVLVIEKLATMFLFPFLGMQNDLQFILIFAYALRGIVLLLLFYLRKSIALGYLLSLVLDFISNETLFSYFGELTTH